MVTPGEKRSYRMERRERAGKEHQVGRYARLQAYGTGVASGKIFVGTNNMRPATRATWTSPVAD